MWLSRRPNLPEGPLPRTTVGLNAVRNSGSASVSLSGRLPMGSTRLSAERPSRTSPEGCRVLPRSNQKFGRHSPEARGRDYRALVRKQLAANRERSSAHATPGTRSGSRSCGSPDKFRGTSSLKTPRDNRSTLEAFARARTPRATLDRAATQLVVSREATWQRFTAAIATAKEGERWRQHEAVLWT